MELVAAVVIRSAESRFGLVWIRRDQNLPCLLSGLGSNPSAADSDSE